MPFIRAASAALMLAFVSSTTSATAPNTTAANAVSYEVGQGWVSHYIEETTQNRWFKFTTTGGRGYCVEAAQGSDSPVAFNPNVTVYGDAAGTSLMGSNDNGAFDPAMTLGSRYCFADTTTLDARTIRTIKLNVPVAAGSGDNGYMRLRVYETTFAGSFQWYSYPSDPNNYYGGINVVNAGGSPITIYYQTRGQCYNVVNGANCTPANPSGTITIQPRSSTTITGFNQGGTTGDAWVVIAVAAPLTDVRAYSVTGTSSTSLSTLAKSASSAGGPTIDVIRSILPLN